ncbi:TaqI-like C-terminal specificity domain-containing protein [Pedobacter sp. FW305-3-2-15-E-R2A2]|uniref:TaqI-like C-terminal specificity domain-containing protein n=1 Tax=Pedobacter sp. FW305-3-2-15-E-R2A2 TaxID=3140251 RepID=UPI00313FFCF4
MYKINLCNFLSSKTSVFVRQKSIYSGFTTSESWVILSSIEKDIKQKIETKGIPLKDWDININYGIKTGYNDAFIISGEKRDELIFSDPKSEEIIRPILRGRDIKRYGYEFADNWLITSHNGIKEKGIDPIDINDYPAVKEHLDHHYSSLERRADKGITPYNLRNCAYMEDFYRQKIVWGNLNLTAAYTVAEGGIFINAPCPIIVPANKYLLAILNSKLADYYIRKLGVTRNGGYFEYKPMFIEKLPVPLLEREDQDVFIEIVDKILDHKAKNIDIASLENELNELVFKLYELETHEVDFLKQKTN